MHQRKELTGPRHSLKAMLVNSQPAATPWMYVELVE
jgi:hypothetical protein